MRRQAAGPWAAPPGCLPTPLTAPHRSAGDSAHSPAARMRDPPTRTRHGALQTHRKPEATRFCLERASQHATGLGLGHPLYNEEADDMATEHRRHRQPAPLNAWLQTQGFSLRSAGPGPWGICEDLQMPCQGAKLTIASTIWAPWGQGRPPTRQGPGPWAFLGRRPQWGVAEDPGSSSSHRC